MEVALLSHGIPYAAIATASEQQILRWYAVVSELNEAETDRINAMMSGLE